MERSEVLQQAKNFKTAKDAIDMATESWEKRKKNYYEIFEEFFEENGYEGSIVLDVEESDKEFAEDTTTSVKITRVQRTKTKWDVEKLKGKISKQQFNKVVKSTYTIANFEGLVSYLKECGVDPKKFVSFLSVARTVDERALINLEELGEINFGQLEGTYTESLNDPYFMVDVRRDKAY